MLETAWESRWLPGPFKKSFLLILRDQAGVAIRKWKMYLENCTQRRFFFKRKATSDFYDKKELRLNQFSQ